MFAHLELTIDELLLDENNPRLGAAGSQSEALEMLVNMNQSNFRNMMISIRNNSLDPGDSLYVIEADDDEDYVVLEGNRRLAALMVLVNPDVLDSTNVSITTKKSLERAASGFDRKAVEPIRCVLFPGREAAHDWIYRRHTGSADGEGRITWGSTEIQRFTGDRSILDVMDFVGRNAVYTEEEWASTKSMIESRKSSNLARILESATGRKYLAISIATSDGERVPMLGSDPKWALKVVQRIIEDVRDGVVDSRELNKASDIENYFKNLPKGLQQKKGKKAVLRAFKEINIKGGGTSASRNSRKKTSTKKSKVPRPRTTLASKRNPFNPPSSAKGEQLLREAGLLDADRFKVSAAFLLRAFIELAIDDYMDANGLPKDEKNKKGNMVELDLSKRVERVIQDMRTKRLWNPDDLRGFRKHVVNTSAATSMQSLNDFLHNKFQIPTGDALRSGWDSAVPVFIAAFGKS
jgi:hypothetical protein